MTSVCTSAEGIPADNEQDSEEEFIVVKGVKVPRVRGGKRWEEHSKNSQKKIIALCYKKAFRKHQRKLQRQEAPVVAKESEKLRTQFVNASPVQDKFPEKIKVVIDCGYIDFMSAKEVCKLATQIGRSYGTNNKMEEPFQLYLTRLASDGAIKRECQRQLMGFDSFPIIQSEKHPSELFELSKMLYLTPDAKDDLLSLEHDKVYIIGGLVDEHINKGLCLQQAKNKGMATAKLPIGSYMTNPSSKRSSVNVILSINQVLEVLAMIRHGHQWPQALANCIPKRKGLVLKDKYVT